MGGHCHRPHHVLFGLTFRWHLFCGLPWLSVPLLPILAPRGRASREDCVQTFPGCPESVLASLAWPGGSGGEKPGCSEQDPGDRGAGRCQPGSPPKAGSHMDVLGHCVSGCEHVPTCGTRASLVCWPGSKPMLAKPLGGPRASVQAGMGPRASELSDGHSQAGPSIPMGCCIQAYAGGRGS